MLRPWRNSPPRRTKQRHISFPGVLHWSRSLCRTIYRTHRPPLLLFDSGVKAPLSYLKLSGLLYGRSVLPKIPSWTSIEGCDVGMGISKAGQSCIGHYSQYGGRGEQRERDLERERERGRVRGQLWGGKWLN